MQKILAVLVINGLLLSGNLVAAPDCTPEFKREVLKYAGNKKTIAVKCNLTLSRANTVTKRLIFEGPAASGVTLNCNGATLHGGKGKPNYNKDMIEVRSKAHKDANGNITKWERPERVTINRCNIIGSVRVWGMGRNGEDKNIKRSSKRERTRTRAFMHVRRVRNNAPRYIVFNRVVITGVGRNPFYLAPGVTYSKLINSEMKGKSKRVAIYLDAESAYNTIKNNYIHLKTAKDKWGKVPGVTDRGWPVIAIDGSAGNRIIGNRFSALNRGGIYFYRNCGEGGTIRHTTPSHNLIINNSFYYKKYKGRKPAVYLGSRNYGRLERLGHCNDDDGRPYGSSRSEKDYARFNVIMQNQFYKRLVIETKSGRTVLVKAEIRHYVRTKNRKLNSPNYIAYNTIVSRAVRRKSGCYVRRAYTDFLRHRQYSDVYIPGRGRPPRCSRTRQTCNDGTLVRAPASGCRITTVSLGCRALSTNRGCSRRASCGRRFIVAAKAACNLETGRVTTAQVSAVPANVIRVVRKSDRKSYKRSHCLLGKTKLRKGQKGITGIGGLRSVTVACKEHDKNGGDCEIKGLLYCR